MVSLESCEKLRREVEQILSVGENLVDEEQYCFDVLAKSNGPKKCLDLARELKEEGNLLFKKGFFDEALENYGYAGVALIKFNFKEEEERAMFFDLAIAILLNLTACLSKRNEFGLVGQVCTVILDYCPNKVKAIYRRAEAAMKLGKFDWAYWDLLLAEEIEPKNKEVAEKLDEVKRYFHKNGANSYQQNEAPIGLGVSLPATKKFKGKIGYNGASDQGIFHEVKQGVVKSCESGEVSLKDEKVCMADGSESGSSSLSSSSTLQEVQGSRPQGVSNIEKEGVSYGVKCGSKDEEVCSTISSSLSCVSEGPQVVCKNKVFNRVKSKFHFNNRKRQCSMTINERDYTSLTQGKTLMFYNAKLGSFMEVRIASNQVEESTSKHDSNVQGSQCQLQSKEESNFKEEVQESANPIKEMEDTGSCVSFDLVPRNSVQSKGFYKTSDGRAYQTVQTTLTPQFCFSADSDFKALKKRHHIKVFGSNHSQGNNRRRRKINVNNGVSFSQTNSFFGCRLNSSRKRKCSHPPPWEFCRFQKRRSSFIGSHSDSIRSLNYGCQVDFVCNNTLRM